MLSKIFLLSLFFLSPQVFNSGDIVTGNNTIQAEFPRKTNNSLGVKLDSEAAVVLDAVTGKILFSKNAFSERAPASLTKMMTAKIILDSKKDLGYPVEIAEESTDLVERTIDLTAGESIRARDLLNAALITSANDAADALAEDLSDGNLEKFIEKMNKEAQKMELKNTNFETPTGLDEEGQTSSAYDLARLFRKMVENQTFKNIITKKGYEFEAIGSDKKHKFENSNRLLRDGYPAVVGGKTGYTDEAGFCLANLAVDKEGNKIVTVVLGAHLNGNQFDDTKALIDWTYNNYSWKKN